MCAPKIAVEEAQLDESFKTRSRRGKTEIVPSSNPRRAARRSSAVHLDRDAPSSNARRATATTGTTGTHDWYTRLVHTTGIHDWYARLVRTTGSLPLSSRLPSLPALQRAPPTAARLEAPRLPADRRTDPRPRYVRLPSRAPSRRPKTHPTHPTHPNPNYASRTEVSGPLPRFFATTPRGRRGPGVGVGACAAPPPPPTRPRSPRLFLARVSPMTVNCRIPTRRRVQRREPAVLPRRVTEMTPRRGSATARPALCAYASAHQARPRARRVRRPRGLIRARRRPWRRGHHAPREGIEGGGRARRKVAVGGDRRRRRRPTDASDAPRSATRGEERVRGGAGVEMSSSRDGATSDEKVRFAVRFRAQSRETQTKTETQTQKKKSFGVVVLSGFRNRASLGRLSVTSTPSKRSAKSNM